MVKIPCRSCGAALPGVPAKWRALRRYCSVRCRRSMEYRRRTWDRRQGWVRAAEENAAWSGLTPAQREAHRRLAGELRREGGPRP